MTDVDLARYLRVVRKWSWLIVLATVGAAVCGYWATQSMPRIYRTSTTLMVGEVTSSPSVTADEFGFTQRAANAYAALVRRQGVLEPTVKALGLPTDWRELQGRVLVNRSEGTQFLEIVVVDSDPARAKATADEIAHQLILQSPTEQNLKQLEDRQRFLQDQLDSLSAAIRDDEAAVAEKQAAMQKETSARGVLDLQDAIKALELRLSTARSTYATLLASSQLKKAPNALTVLDAASVPTEPISPNVRANVLMAGALGLLLALGGVFAIEYLDDAPATADDVARVLTVPVLGAIARMRTGKSPTDLVVAQHEPQSRGAEAYRVLRTSVQFAMNGWATHLLLVSSPNRSEGKSVTCANLAVTFAQAGLRTILVDADLRKPSLHTLFGRDNDDGLTRLVVDQGASAPGQVSAWFESSAEDVRRLIESSLVATDVPGLRLLPSGPVPPNPAEILASSRMEQLLRILQRIADVVILDSPPVLPVADASVLAAYGAAVVLVVRAGATRSRAARTAKNILDQARVPGMGVVLNWVSRSSLGYEYGYHVAAPKPSLLARAVRLPRVGRGG
jgi:Mrp family chromosome partitioning ATPase/capsular polysaccharide biosynthesis protein